MPYNLLTYLLKTICYEWVDSTRRSALFAHSSDVSTDLDIVLAIVDGFGWNDQTLQRRRTSTDTRSETQQVATLSQSSGFKEGLRLGADPQKELQGLEEAT